MRRLVASCSGLVRYVLIGAAAGGALAWPGTARGGTMTGEALADLLAKPGALLLQGTVVTTAVKLERIGTVQAAFECRSCTFTGGISARHVVFARELDIGGATVEGPLDFESASFGGPVVLASAGQPTQVHGPTTFRLASFASLLDAEAVVFGGDADFALARFGGEAVFADATFRGTAGFVGVAFRARARFTNGEFAGEPDFTQAVFESTADFRARVFTGGGRFKAVDFRGFTDFGQATFVGVAEFEDARFTEDATFRGATFGPGEDRALSLGHVVSQKKLDFSGTTFSELVLAESVVARGLSFDGVTFNDPAMIALAGLKVEDLVYPLEAVGRVLVDEHQRSVLGQIETSAKNRGDIGLANDAHYRLQKMTARGYGSWRRAADAVFYRGIAGYFVRPQRPLAVLVALVVALSFLRWLSKGAGGPPATDGRRSTRPKGAPIRDRLVRGLTGPSRRLAGFAHELVDTFGLTVPRLRGGDRETETPGLGRRLEILSYRLLVVCALLGLANSNPTLRQMFDALV